MKKIIIYIAFALLVSPLVRGQEFEIGTNVLNGGIGFGGYYGYSLSSSISQTPVFSVSYEKGIWEAGPGVISLGGYFGRKSYSSQTLEAQFKWSYSIIGIRGAYHYNGFEVENLDVYGGVMASFNIYNGDSFGGYGSRPSLTPFVGGRWYFDDDFAGFAEAGYGVAFFSIGASFKF